MGWTGMHGLHGWMGAHGYAWWVDVDRPIDANDGCGWIYFGVGCGGCGECGDVWWGVECVVGCG